jgi:hypothetical protein
MIGPLVATLPRPRAFLVHAASRQTATQGGTQGAAAWQYLD